MQKYFQDHANLAYKILNQSQNYKKNKDIISNFFEVDKNLTKDKILTRLTLIDSFYSTQMNKRLFGLEELSHYLYNISQNDLQLQERILSILEKKDIYNNKELSIFSEKFGINKRGQRTHTATSLISKYFYFIMKYEFPIYDNLVKQYLPKIQSLYYQKEIMYKQNPSHFFQEILSFNKQTNINSFNKLDNLCWLVGKFNKGSFSLILTQNQYCHLINKIQIDINEKNIDTKIANYIFSDPARLNDIFSIDQLQFIDFIKQVNNFNKH